MCDEDLELKYWFASIMELSTKRKKELYREIGDVKDIYHIYEYRKNNLSTITEKEIHIIEKSKIEWNLEKRYRHFKKLGGMFVLYGEEGYPSKLLFYDDAPFALFYLGILPKNNILSVAIVGARRCSEYGKYYARVYGGMLANNGIQVISGMAMGVDGIAQRAALNSGGRCFGVLGCGVDICYPKEHRGLYKDLIEGGGLISEYPIGTSPLPYYFPLRNRIISGLSDVVLIIEAKEKSGSLITADLAMDQGKDVYALPGEVTNALSQGCHYLIKQGAGILISPEELIKDLEVYGSFNKKITKENKIILESAEKLVYSCLCLSPLHMEEVLKQTKLPVEELMNLLVSLELKGYIREVSKNYYVKNY